MPRERLFRVLDAKREFPVVWVTGPPGSGKTTLVTSYLEAISAPAIWYLLDSGDSDPATFFFYLAKAAAVLLPPRTRALPLLTTEYLPDLEGFSRRFMRETFSRLPEGTVLVLDNYHEIAAGSALHRMLNAAINEVPRHASLVIISRTPPPGSFARAQVANTLVTLGWDELRLEPEETAAIVARGKDIDGHLIAAIHAQSGGWVAGVRLLLERVSPATNSAVLSRPEALESAFDYFAAEIFDAAPDSVRQLMMRTAFLPRFTVDMAVTLSGEEQARRHIDQMFRRRLFIDRRVGEDVTYQYHDLFRAFLRSRAHQYFPPNVLAAIIRESARLLLSANLVDEAFGLFILVKDWARAEDIFLDQAPRLISSGRWLTLEDWADSLPRERLEANPWLLYWLGCSKALVDAAAAFPILEAAYDCFVEKHDPSGRILCAAAVVETLHFVVAHWETMGVWLNRLKESLDAQKDPLPPDDELRVHAALFWAADNSDPGSEIIAPSVERSLQLLPLCRDVNLRVSVANILHYHAERTLDARATQIAAQEARSVLDSPDLSADRHALYYLSEGFAHFDFARYREAFECYDRADAIIEAHGLVGRDHIAGVWRAYCQYAAGDLQAAQITLAHTETLKPADLHVITMVLETTRSWVAFGCGEMTHALEHNQDAINIAETLGPYSGLTLFLPNRAYMLIAAGQWELAGIPIERIREEPRLVEYQRVGGAIALLDAWQALRSGDEARCHKALRDSLSLAKDERDRLRMRWYPKALAELLQIALGRHIETETARTLICECRLDPPSSATDAWPWPVKIYTLGRFEILVDEKLLEFGRKAPKRTLALLKALIALGGTDVPEQRLIDALWPDQEGDAAVESLAAALHRLRRLLGSNDTIRQSGGLLSLNAQRAFVDAWTFEGSTDETGRHKVTLDYYRGDFLPGDNEPWAASMRERLRGKFVRAVENAGHDLESSGRSHDAIDLYLRGIGTDDLIEPFYRGLMRCYGNLGRHAEAAGTFRRLRQTLSVTLGVKPSAESQRLFETLRLQ